MRERLQKVAADLQAMGFTPAGSDVVEEFTYAAAFVTQKLAELAENLGRLRLRIEFNNRGADKGRNEKLAAAIALDQATILNLIHILFDDPTVTVVETQLNRTDGDRHQRRVSLMAGYTIGFKYRYQRYFFRSHFLSDGLSALGTHNFETGIKALNEVISKLIKEPKLRTDEVSSILMACDEVERKNPPPSDPFKNALYHLVTLGLHPDCDYKGNMNFNFFHIPGKNYLTLFTEIRDQFAEYRNGTTVLPAERFYRFRAGTPPITHRWEKRELLAYDLRGLYHTLDPDFIEHIKNRSREQILEILALMAKDWINPNFEILLGKESFVNGMVDDLQARFEQFKAGNIDLETFRSHVKIHRDALEVLLPTLKSISADLRPLDPWSPALLQLETDLELLTAEARALRHASFPVSDEEAKRRDEAAKAFFGGQGLMIPMGREGLNEFTLMVITFIPQLEAAGYEAQRVMAMFLHHQPKPSADVTRSMEVLFRAAKEEFLKSMRGLSALCGGDPVFEKLASTAEALSEKTPAESAITLHFLWKATMRYLPWAHPQLWLETESTIYVKLVPHIFNPEAHKKTMGSIARLEKILTTGEDLHAKEAELKSIIAQSPALSLWFDRLNWQDRESWNATWFTEQLDNLKRSITGYLGSDVSFGGYGGTAFPTAPMNVAKVEKIPDPRLYLKDYVSKTEVYEAAFKFLALQLSTKTVTLYELLKEKSIALILPPTGQEDTFKRISELINEGHGKIQQKYPAVRPVQMAIYDQNMLLFHLPALSTIELEWPAEFEFDSSTPRDRLKEIEGRLIPMPKAPDVSVDALLIEQMKRTPIRIHIDTDDFSEAMRFNYTESRTHQLPLSQETADRLLSELTVTEDDEQEAGRTPGHPFAHLLFKVRYQLEVEAMNIRLLSWRVRTVGIKDREAREALKEEFKKALETYGEQLMSFGHALDSNFLSLLGARIAKKKVEDLVEYDIPSFVWSVVDGVEFYIASYYKPLKFFSFSTRERLILELVGQDFKNYLQDLHSAIEAGTQLERKGDRLTKQQLSEVLQSLAMGLELKDPFWRLDNKATPQKQLEACLARLRDTARVIDNYRQNKIRIPQTQNFDFNAVVAP